jgi:hypothetical protein
MYQTIITCEGSPAKRDGYDFAFMACSARANAFMFLGQD